MTLDLRNDSPIQICAVGAVNYGCKGKIVWKKDGNYTVSVLEKSVREIEVHRLFGIWWVDAGKNQKKSISFGSNLNDS